MQIRVGESKEVDTHHSQRWVTTFVHRRHRRQVYFAILWIHEIVGDHISLMRSVHCHLWRISWMSVYGNAFAIVCTVFCIIQTQQRSKDQRNSYPIFICDGHTLWTLVKLLPSSPLWFLTFVSTTILSSLTPNILSRYIWKRYKINSNDDWNSTKV